MATGWTMGGHRFFSKSDRVMNWWLNILPLQASPGNSHQLGYQGKKKNLHAPRVGSDPGTQDCVMLIRKRRSRLYFMHRFIDLPDSAESCHIEGTVGPSKSCRIRLNCLRSRLFRIRNEETLEAFMINRFGRELYETF
jgi:protoporphyrinogen oxidase